MAAAPRGLPPALDELAFAKLVRLPDPKTKRLGPWVPTPEQLRVLTVLSQRGPDGLRLIRELVLHWFRQSGKTMLLGDIGLYGLVADPFHTDRLVVIAASDEEQGLRV